MFAELMGKDQGTNRGRGGSMHIADPKLGIFGANGIVAGGPPDRRGSGGGGPTPGRRRSGGGVLRRRGLGPGGIPRGHEPGRGVEAAGDLLLREQRVRRVLPGRRPSTPPPSSSGPRATASRTWRSTATTWRRRPRSWTTWWSRDPGGSGPGRGRSHHLPVARPLRGGPAALPVAGRGRAPGRLAIRCSSMPTALDEAGVGATTRSRQLEATVAERARRRRGGCPGRWPTRRPATLTDFVVRARPARAEPPPPAERCAGVPHHGRHPVRSRSRARPRTNGSSWPASTSGPEATCSA